VKVSQGRLDRIHFSCLLIVFDTISTFRESIPGGLQPGKAVASEANLESRNVLLFPTSTKTAAVGVNKQYHLQSSVI
jgi:hypothetical protein